MAQILDYGTDWKLVLDENVNPVEEIRKPEEGYVASIGESRDTGLHTISYVLYHKEYTDPQGNLATRTVDDILQKVDDLRNCQRCTTLDKDKLNVDSIEFQSQNSSGFVTNPSQVMTQPDVTPSSSLRAAPSSEPSSPVTNMFSEIIVDTLLTDPGKYFLGTFLNDKKMVDSAIKGKKPEEFASEMFDFMEGKTDIVRSSEEAHDFLSIMRESNEKKANPTAKLAVVRTGPRTVIY